MTALRDSLRREPRAWAAVLGTIALGLAALVPLDVLLAHGWTAAWHARHEGERVELARTVEHRLAFHNDRRTVARTMAAWDFARLGMPSVQPPVDVTLTARLTVPSGGRRLVTEAEGEVAIRIDGAPITGDLVVPAGAHDLEIDWRCANDRGPRFVLRWVQGEGDQEIVSDVPRDALVPGDGAWPATRIALWLAGSAAFAVTALLLFVALRDGRLHARRHLHTLATLWLVAIAIGFRGFDYDVSPDPRDNEDELFAMWNGHSLLHDGVSRGWTLWPQLYIDEGPEVGVVSMEHYVYRSFHVVTPYFEHPPLLHVMVGAVGMFGGAADHLEMRHAHGRLVPLALSGLVVVLILAIGRRLDRGSPAPYFAALLWATLPWIALQTRVVKEEALVTPLGLGVVLAFLVWRDHPDRAREVASPAARRWLVLAASLAGLAVLTKVTGLAFSIALGVLVARVGRARDVGIVAIGAIVGVSVLCLYGASLGWDAFLFAQETQSHRPVHFNIFLRFFDDPMINHSLVGRGWLLFLWLAAMASFFARQRRDTAALVVPLFAYLGAIGLGSGTWTYGWYMTPLLPFLCLGAGRFLADLWRDPELGRGSILVLTLVLYSLNFATSETYFFSAETDPYEPRRLVTSVLAALLVPFGLAQAFGWRGVGRVGLVASLITMIVISIAFVGGYDVAPHRDFDRNSSYDV